MSRNLNGNLKRPPIATFVGKRLVLRTIKDVNNQLHPSITDSNLDVQLHKARY